MGRFLCPVALLLIVRRRLSVLQVADMKSTGDLSQEQAQLSGEGRSQVRIG